MTSIEIQNETKRKMEKSLELSKSIEGIEVPENLKNQKKELFENSQII